MGQRLLVVDNDRAFLDEQKAALEAAFEVEYLSATDGAMPRLELGGIAAVLICVEVSENKGYALCSTIRRHPQLQDLKIVLISAKATQEEYARHQSLKGHADLYLHKPMEPEALVASLSPFVPIRAEKADDLLGDLEGTDLGDEWLESLKTELEVDFAPLPEQVPVLEPATTRVFPEVALERRVQELEDLVRDRERLLEAKDKELAERSGGSGDLDRLQYLEGAHAAAEEELVRLRENLIHSQERILALERENPSTGGSDDMERELKILKQDVAGLEGTLRGQRRELAEQVMRCEDLEREAGELRSRAETAESRVEELELSQNALREEAGAAQRELDAARAQLLEKEQLLARNDELEVRAAELQAALEQAEAEREVFRTDLEASQAQLAKVETDMAEKSAWALQKEQELAALGEQLEAIRSTRDRQAEELKEALGNLEAVHAERDQAQARYAELEERVDREAKEWETQRMELLVGIDEREASLSRMKTTMVELESRLANLETEKAELDGHLNERTARLDSLTNVISDLEAGIRRASDLTRPF